MFEFEKPNIEINEISEDNRFGRFVVEPLERGYGTTLGNSLRRIMLSSLPGAAVSSVKIKGDLAGNTSECFCRITACGCRVCDRWRSDRGVDQSDR